MIFFYLPTHVCVQMYCVKLFIFSIGSEWTDASYMYTSMQISALCPHNMLVPLHVVHHAVTCKFGGDVVPQHYQLRDAFVQTCRLAGVSTSI